ncbi:MAG: hypothetical protein ACPLPS_09795 [bacterium]
MKVVFSFLGNYSAGPSLGLCLGSVGLVVRFFGFDGCVPFGL